jgi:hypothetical protein
MKHFLAYGNSDQETFRVPQVQSTYDVITVPGTIASFYQDATAAFILTAQKPYIIDPRTPLLQGAVGAPKASHLTLAEWLGASFSDRVRGSGGGALQVPETFFTAGVIDEMVAELVARQRQYGGHATRIEAKLDRYRRLRAQAHGVEAATADPVSESRPPLHVLSPYFACSGLEDPWWRILLAVWDACAGLDDSGEISGVVAVTSPDFLQEAMGSLPSHLAQTSFYWVTGFDERKASVDALTLVSSAIATSGSRRWINLYGGYFSICMSFLGLWGFSNGLGYSESRDWPELASTGAAPPRYYIPDLHLFLPPGTAQLVVEQDPSFSCSCTVCESQGGAIISLGYHQLKQHFALSRGAEIAFVQESSPTEVGDQLRTSHARFFDDVAPHLPSSLIPDLRFMLKWSDVVQSLSSFQP